MVLPEKALLDKLIARKQLEDVLFLTRDLNPSDVFHAPVCLKRAQALWFAERKCEALELLYFLYEVSGSEVVAIELMKSQLDAGDSQSVFPALSRTFPSQPKSEARDGLVAQLEASTDIYPRYLNIGGGPMFVHPYWYNVDEFNESQAGLRKQLDSTIGFPIPDDTFELAYSSHCFEHLDDQTLDGLFREIHKKCLHDAAFVIKIPDFERIIKSAFDEESDFLAPEKWNFKLMTPTWHRRNVVDTAFARAAYLLCGYWTPEFGHLFGKRDVNAEGAYHGPPPLSDQDYRTILNGPSPNAIVKALKAKMSEDGPYTFNHQNAWNHKEFVELITGYGFRFVASSPELICKLYANIPGIREMFDISSYFLFRKCW